MKRSTKEKAAGKLREARRSLEDALDASARARHLTAKGQIEEKGERTQVKVGRIDLVV